MFSMRAILALTFAAATLQACSNGSHSVNSAKATRSSAQTSFVKWSIVPIPREIKGLPGALTLPPWVAIRTSDDAARAVAMQLASALQPLGVQSIVDASDARLTIRLTNNAKLPNLGSEGYKLDVGESGISLVANTDTGLYYGSETLEQLVTTNGRTADAIPYVQIVDWPEYRWRGLHLDVSRHFFPKNIVENYIDIASRFKLNRFHWHLTDDQGWRLEVPEYPELTKIGGCRDATQTGGFGSTTTDGKPTCSHYTDSDVREIVAFAKARHVQVIPEIEGPGHSVEAMAAYESLACTPGPYATLTLWGSTRYSVCPTTYTFKFYDDVLRKLAELFPAKYVHIGGDEVPYSSWRGDPIVASLMRREGLETYADVQGYFTRRLQELARKYHKRIVGWDEINKAGVSHDAIVMAWTGRIAGLTALRHGNDVVMTPNPPLYFDAYQGPPDHEPTAIGGLTTLDMVYRYDPMESNDSPELRTRILGAQANVWTEYIPTSDRLWYMAYPRTLALSELCWSPRYRMDWVDFKRRAGIALQRLEPLGVTFRIPEVTFRIKSSKVGVVPVKLNKYRADLPASSPDVRVALDDVVPNATIYYTLDGSIPDESSNLYGRPIRLKAGDEIAAVAVIPGYHNSSPSFLIAGAL